MVEKSIACVQITFYIPEIAYIYRTLWSIRRQCVAFLRPAASM